MNILFIGASAVVKPASSGIIRVTNTLRELFESKGHKCSHGYYKELETKTYLFERHIKLEVGREETVLFDAIKEWNIEVIIFQLFPTKELNDLLYKIRAYYPADDMPKLITCLHERPYHDAVGYNWNYIMFLQKERNFKFHIRIKKILWAMLCMYNNKYAHKILSNRYQKTIDNSDKFVLLSDLFIKEIEDSQTRGYDKICYAYNPYSYAIADKSVLEGKEKLILFVGRIDEDSKRISECLRVWKRIEQNNMLQDWHFDIVGDGADMLYYQRIIKKNGLKRVRLCGKQNPTDWYRRASILLLTSAYEGYPLVISEAMAFGAVPVAYNCTAALENMIASGKDGIIVEQGNRQELYNNIIDLMTDTQKLRKMQETCLTTKSCMSEEKVYSLWQGILS